MEKEYLTILGTATSEYSEKKSLFISNAKNVECEPDALAFMNTIKEKYRDATHHVFAYYMIHPDGTPIQRYNDDGEPSGTAGLPTLNTIQRKSLQNIVIVTTRYFGGTMLGASGLIRAYGKSSTLCLENANTVIRCLMNELSVTIDYTLQGKVQNMLHENNVTIKNIEYTEKVSMYILIPTDKTDTIWNAVIEATNAKAVIEIKNTGYVTLDLHRNIVNADDKTATP